MTSKTKPISNAKHTNPRKETEQVKHLEKYLASSDIINWEHPDVLAKSREMSVERGDPVSIARACFKYVRDEIRHSGDFELNPVTCTASDVLKHRTGYCYAKSHLLAALLRANRIPAGLCYQRLTISDDRPGFCLHGLNAVLLPDVGWYRIDARGNKPGLNAQFAPPVERLAFIAAADGEVDLPEIWPEPLPEVVRVLESRADYRQVAHDLPDVELVQKCLTNWRE